MTAASTGSGQFAPIANDWLYGLRAKIGFKKFLKSSLIILLIKSLRKLQAAPRLRWRSASLVLTKHSRQNSIAKTKRSNYSGVLMWQAKLKLYKTSRALHKFIFPLLLLGCTLAFPVTGQDRLAALVGDGSVMLHSPNGEMLVSINPNGPLVPASLLKIPLAHVALTTLGEDSVNSETLAFRMIGYGR